MWIGLNPSTADEEQLDPTLRRIKRFSAENGYNCFYMTNLFGLRSTNPANLYADVEPVGAGNDAALLMAAANCDKIIAAWGNHGSYLKRDQDVLKLLSSYRMLCLCQTSTGAPGHPLYLAAKMGFVEMVPAHVSNIVF